jgi:hypothetical protein
LGADTGAGIGAVTGAVDGVPSHTVACVSGWQVALRGSLAGSARRAFLPLYRPGWSLYSSIDTLPSPILIGLSVYLQSVPAPRSLRGRIISVL